MSHEYRKNIRVVVVHASDAFDVIKKLGMEKFFEEKNGPLSASINSYSQIDKNLVQERLPFTACFWYKQKRKSILPFQEMRTQIVVIDKDKWMNESSIQKCLEYFFFVWSWLRRFCQEPGPRTIQFEIPASKAPECNGQIES